MLNSVKDKNDLLAAITANKSSIERYGVIRIGLFGSFVRNEQKNNSDIDLVVEFKDGKKNYNNFIHLAFYLDELLGRKVELVTPQSISPYIKPYIMQEIEYVRIAS